MGLEDYANQKIKSYEKNLNEEMRRKQNIER